MGGKNSRIYESISRSKIDLEDDNDVIEPLPEPAAPEPTDPRLPLTTRQVYRLRKSWKGIKRQMGPTGIELFIRYSVNYHFCVLASFSYLMKVKKLVSRESTQQVKCLICLSVMLINYVVPCKESGFAFCSFCLSTKLQHGMTCYLINWVHT